MLFYDSRSFAASIFFFIETKIDLTTYYHTRQEHRYRLLKEAPEKVLCIIAVWNMHSDTLSECTSHSINAHIWLKTAVI